MHQEETLTTEPPIASTQSDRLHVLICGDKNSGKRTLFDFLLNNLSKAASHQQTQDNNFNFEHKSSAVDSETWSIASTTGREFSITIATAPERNNREIHAALFKANVAIILIDATCGIQTQAKWYAYLASSFKIRHLILGVNKMDLMDFDPHIFRSIEQDFHDLCSHLDFASTAIIPMASLQGNNVLNPSIHTSWYDGFSLIGYLATIETAKITDNRFIFLAQKNNPANIHSDRCNGMIANGQITIGDTVRIAASGETARVKDIRTLNKDVFEAHTNEVVTLILDKEVKISCNDVISAAHSPLETTDQFTAVVIWTHAEPGLVGRNYRLILSNQQVDASITTIKYRLDVNTGIHEACQQLKQNDIAACNLALNHPVAFDTYTTLPVLGSFVLVDQYSHATIATGLIMHNLRRAQNVHRQALSICREDRERLNGHKGKVIWLTGLSGSGKSTIANALEKQLHSQGKRTYILDGDNVRHGLNKDLGFTNADRVENIRRVAEVAKLMMDAGLIVITAFISPFRAEREMARQLIGKENFVEVYIDTPLEICEQRDPKGLYKKARSGELPNMTGISSPYESPEHPSLVIDGTDTVSAILVSLLTRFE
ncbi:adenylyl-sulfate kinase [Nitrosomonas sp. HPC101]|uniref:adenylyl-sulfate kinase n=1 Tax=Nitrosomonas sp. HPC101 TaxID=1658667 RepID=UPI001F043C06|nr:adenylyl-sulfate kinase [Nitrosomonas sp. HPC101]